MRLNLPEQNAPTADSSPSNPRKLKKVLSALPNANMGELTRQTFQILRDQNRQAMPNKHRLENLEMLREQARKIFNNLKKYFINRTLPLSDKSQKIVNLNQSILRELINGYEIIVYEAANNIDTNIDDKTLNIAICRAIKYLSEMYLRSSEVYAACPKNLWFDIHQLYAFAESKNLTANIVIDEENEQEKTTIESCYKQILLFALARPITLRQSDSERVFKKLYQWSQYASITHDASEKLIDTVFCIKIQEDSAPDYLSKNDLNDGACIRILNVDKLISHIETISTQQKNNQKLAIGDTIPVETLEVLVSAWAENAKRRFSRADRHGDINVAIGLKLAAKTIRASMQKEEKVNTKTFSVRTSASIKQDPDFSLQSIVTDADKREQGYMTHTEIADIENNSWDMVAKGRVLTDTYTKERKLIDEGQLNLNRRKTDSQWAIVNISAGGYCLRWNSDDTSHAQIGELIALQEFDSRNNFEWRIGVIRWMQFTQKNGLEIGVQAISPKVIAATAHRFNKPDETPFDCLILPGIKALKQASSTLLPAHAFKTNDKLVVQLAESELNITLGSTKEHTGSFTQFTYENTTEDQLIRKKVKKEETTKNKDDFDELWSSL